MIDKKLMLALAVVVFLALGLSFILLVMIPVHLDVQSKCLALGYPSSKVTFSLDGYCTNLNESVPLSGVKK